MRTIPFQKVKWTMFIQSWWSRGRLQVNAVRKVMRRDPPCRARCRCRQRWPVPMVLDSIQYEKYIKYIIYIIGEHEVDASST